MPPGGEQIHLAQTNTVYKVQKTGTLCSFPPAVLAKPSVMTVPTGRSSDFHIQYLLAVCDYRSYVVPACLLLDRMERQAPAPSLLLLPDSCLLAVLQCCAADDLCSLFSVARVHSKLRQVAAAALPSIEAVVTSQRQLDSMLLYLDQHGLCVDSVELYGNNGAPPLSLRQLPPSLQLSNLQLTRIALQLHPAAEFQGVLGAVIASGALKRLRLNFCTLLDGSDAVLSAALSQLPAGLEHLSVSGLSDPRGHLRFPAGVLQRLQQLISLELADMPVPGFNSTSPAQQPLQALTRLVDLQLDRIGQGGVTATLLACTHHLTRLKVSGSRFEPGALGGKTRLQHLELPSCRVPFGDVAQLLSHLQPLQQLTHLCLVHSLRFVAGEDRLPAASYAPLTASSKLQHLDLYWCDLPEGVWQHMFPTGRQLPFLRVLFVSSPCPVATELPDRAAPEGSRLVSCCPGLQSLNMQGLQVRAMHLAPLQGLTGLHTLRVTIQSGMAAEGVGAVCQLTGLRELAMQCYDGTRQELLQLTQLKQLTQLTLQWLGH